MLRKGPTSLLEVGPFVYSLKRLFTSRLCSYRD